MILITLPCQQGRGKRQREKLDDVSAVSTYISYKLFLQVLPIHFHLQSGVVAIAAMILVTVLVTLLPLRLDLVLVPACWAGGCHL